jgi:hypothetical protein
VAGAPEEQSSAGSSQHWALTGSSHACKSPKSSHVCGGRNPGAGGPGSHVSTLPHATWHASYAVCAEPSLATPLAQAAPQLATPGPPTPTNATQVRPLKRHAASSLHGGRAHSVLLHVTWHASYAVCAEPSAATPLAQAAPQLAAPGPPTPTNAAQVRPLKRHAPSSTHWAAAEPSSAATQAQTRAAVPMIRHGAPATAAASRFSLAGRLGTAALVEVLAAQRVRKPSAPSPRTGRELCTAAGGWHRRTASTLPDQTRWPQRWPAPRHSSLWPLPPPPRA